MSARIKLLALVLSAAFTASCTFGEVDDDEEEFEEELEQTADETDNLNNLDGFIDDALDEAEEIAENMVICDGMTLAELIDAATISDGCKITVQDYLPEAEENFTGRLVVLGTEENEADGSLSIYLHGSDDTGTALIGNAFTSATVTAGGTLLEEGSYSVTLSGDFMRHRRPIA